MANPLEGFKNGILGLIRSHWKNPSKIHGSIGSSSKNGGEQTALWQPWRQQERWGSCDRDFQGAEECMNPVPRKAARPKRKKDKDDWTQMRKRNEELSPSKNELVVKWKQG